MDFKIAVEHEDNSNPMFTVPQDVKPEDIDENK